MTHTLAQDQDILNTLAGYIKEAGSTSAASQSLGIDPKTLRDVLNGQRMIPKRLAFKLGYLPVWIHTEPARSSKFHGN